MTITECRHRKMPNKAKKSQQSNKEKAMALDSLKKFLRIKLSTFEKPKKTINLSISRSASGWASTK